MSENPATNSHGASCSRPRASPETPAKGGGPAISFPAGPHSGDHGVPTRQGPRRRAWRLPSPKWHQDLPALALIITTVATSWLLANTQIGSARLPLACRPRSAVGAAIRFGHPHPAGQDPAVPLAEIQVHERPFQCSMMPVPRPKESPDNPTAQALRAEVAVTPPR
jgi:hypothetical protein